MAIPRIVSEARPPVPNRKRNKLPRSTIPYASQYSACLQMWTAVGTKLGNSNMSFEDCSNTVQPSRSLPTLSPYAAVMPSRGKQISPPLTTANASKANAFLHLYCGPSSHPVNAHKSATAHHGAISRRGRDTAVNAAAMFRNTGASCLRVAATDDGHVSAATTTGSSAIFHQSLDRNVAVTCAVLTGGSRPHRERIIKLICWAAGLQISADSHHIGVCDSAGAYTEDNRFARKRRLESPTSESRAKKVCLRYCSSPKKGEHKRHKDKASENMLSDRTKKRYHGASDEPVGKKARTGMTSTVISVTRFDRMKVC